MTREEILDQVLAFLSEQFPSDEARFDSTTRISDTILVSSLEMLEIVIFLEEEFGLTLSRRDLQHIDTPESITELILTKRSMAE